MIVLDTHVLIWWVNGGRNISSTARAIIEWEQVNGQILISSISCWEMAMLIQQKRIVLTVEFNEWLRTVKEISNVRFVPIDNDIAVQSLSLPGEFHADLADRMITALARKLSVPLVTADPKLRSYQHVNAVW